MKRTSSILSLSTGVLLAGTAFGQFTPGTTPGTFRGPSTGSTPYVLPVTPGIEVISVLTVDNTGANPDDLVPKVGGGTYGMNGIPDGLGAFDNNDGTFTLLMNHELGNTLGVVRDHGAIGSYVSKYVINKNTLAVVNGEDLIKQAFNWNSASQASNPTSSALAFGRFCSADLPPVSAFFNSATNLGTQARLFMHGEEGTATGWQQATVVTGPDAGKSYVLGKFNLTTNNSGLTGVGAWENALANPFAQDKTVVIGLNDGGTGIMNNSVCLYVGQKQATGTEVEKAGLMNGTLTFVNVAGNAVEIANATTRATNITNGTRFSLSGTSATTFSRPEDGNWHPTNPREFFFCTTDRLDQVSDGLGAQIGRTRLWRLTFDDITNPEAGGVIDIIVDAQTVVVNGTPQQVNMFDNMCFNQRTGRIILQEDVGGAAHNGKVWELDLSTFNGTTNSGTLRQLLKHDPTRFGDRVNGVTTAATAPFTNDEETSGVIDITSIMSGGALHRGITNEAWYISVDQAHYTSGITAAQVEGGQLFVMHDTSASAPGISFNRGGFVRLRRTGNYTQQVTITNNSGSAFGPAYFVVDGLPNGVTLLNPSGTTAIAPASPYATVSTGVVAPGASASVTLEFSNPGNAPINYTVRVLSNTGGAGRGRIVAAQ